MSKKTYVALPGVEWVNGKRVPESREIPLSTVEAKFDLAQGRIRLKGDDKQAPKVSAPAKTDEPNKPENGRTKG